MASSNVVAILRLDVEGDGVAEIDGRAVRVPGVIPGERVEVRLVAGRVADVLRVVEASPHRVTPPCRHFGPCGGCTWQHIAYEEQLRLKQQQLQRLLRESLDVRAPVVLPTLPTPAAATPARDPVAQESVAEIAGAVDPASGPQRAPWHYRNKVSFVFGAGPRGRTLVMGHYRRASRSVIPVVECPVHAEEGNHVAFRMRDALERARIPAATAEASEGIARHIVVRVAETGDDWLATLVVTENVRPLRRVTEDFLGAGQLRGGSGEVSPQRFARRRRGSRHTWGLYLNVHDRPGPLLFGRETRHLAGARSLTEKVAGISYLLSPTSFFQTNVRAASVLVSEVLDALRDLAGGARVLDLYAGVGLFALPLARNGHRVTAVDENREAMASAAAAARENGIPERRLRVLAGRVEDAMARLAPRSGSHGWDAVVVDPPREGCPPGVLDWILRTLRPPRLVYVSCNPEALARDLRRVAPAGYAVTRVQPVDMFPHTAHIESVAVLRRS